MSGVIYFNNKRNLYGDFDKYLKQQSQHLNFINHPGYGGLNFDSSGTNGLGSGGSNSINWNISGLMPTPQKYLCRENS